MYPVSPVSSKSFGDSPDGFKGELQEVMVSIGAEYSYNEQFFFVEVIFMRMPIRVTVSISQSEPVSA